MIHFVFLILSRGLARRAAFVRIDRGYHIIKITGQLLESFRAYLIIILVAPHKVVIEDLIVRVDESRSRVVLIITEFAFQQPANGLDLVAHEREPFRVFVQVDRDDLGYVLLQKLIIVLNDDLAGLGLLAGLLRLIGSFRCFITALDERGRLLCLSLDLAEFEEHFADLLHVCLEGC